MSLNPLIFSHTPYNLFSYIKYEGMLLFIEYLFFSILFSLCILYIFLKRRRFFLKQIKSSKLPIIYNKSNSKPLNANSIYIKIKIYLLNAILILLINNIFVLIFIFFFYVNNTFSTIPFLISTSLFFTFSLFFLKFTAHFSHLNSYFNEIKTNKIRFNLLDRLFRIIEEFPYSDKFYGYKKIILKILGWFIPIYCFLVGIYIRSSLEFMSIVINLPYIISMIGFYGFILATGTICTFFFTKSKISHVYKLLLITVPIILQIPIIIDYLIFGIDNPLNYSYIEWSDFIIAIQTFFLHYKIQSYAVKLGHPIMFIILIITSSFYSIYRNLYPKRYTQNKYLIILKILVFNISMYIIFQVSGIFVPYIYKLLDNFFVTRLKTDPIIISNCFYFFIFIAIWLFIYVNEKNIFKRKINFFKNNFFYNRNLKSPYLIYKIEKNVYYLRYKLKLIILLTLIILYEIIIIDLTLL
jgi:hypothetical protein